MWVARRRQRSRLIAPLAWVLRAVVALIVADVYSRNFVSTSHGPRRAFLRLRRSAKRDVIADGSEARTWDGAEDTLRRDLLAWYSRARRRLPWRGDPPPWCEDKSQLRQAAAEEDASRTQPKITGFFSKKLQRTVPCDASPAAVVDLDTDDESVCAPATGSTELPRQDQVDKEGASSKTFARSAYGTWVSEVMLQQTQVERVVSYWTRWMERFPTVQALAAAEWETVNAAWAGLGYYGRARRLHEGAKHVVKVHAGEIPSALEELRGIPGVGPYTAGAVASIAHGKKAAVVDGNVIRVFSRLRAIPGDAASPALVKQCWHLAEAVVDPEQPGTFNQALMELGATVCTPKSPSCTRCPVRAHCRAADLAAAGKVSSVMEFPEKAKKKAPRLRTFAVAVLEDAQGRVLLVRRPSTGLLAGQWEFPAVPMQVAEGARTDSTADEATSERHRERPDHCSARGELQSHLQKLLSSSATLADDKTLHATALVPQEGAPVEHTFSHERHTMHLFRANASLSTACDVPRVADVEETLKNGESDVPETVRWMTADEARAAGVTSGVVKIFTRLGLFAGGGAGVPAPNAKRKRQTTTSAVQRSALKSKEVTRSLRAEGIGS